MKRTALLLGAALAPLAFSGLAQAQSTSPQAVPETSVEEVIVTGQPVMRNRTDDVVPTLSYDLEYFQRFEPLTAGDALKRVPSVAFLSDVLESDGVRLRGLDSSYTQILINGERVPGAGLDRSFFVDRIPAELIERVEVVRSSSANRSGDAVAGAINIVLRDALSLDGGYVRVGALHWDDSEYGEWGGSYGAVWGGQAGPGRLLLGANIQDRRNPKRKFSQRLDRPGGTIDNIEAQTDVRDGTDYSANAAYEVDVAGGKLELSGVFVRTDRLQDEDSIEYRGAAEVPSLIDITNDNDLEIQTDNLQLRSRYEREMFGGETRFKLGYASIDDAQFEFENESEFRREESNGLIIPFPDEDRFTADATRTNINDEELSGAVEHERDLTEGVELEFGVQYNKKDRRTDIREATRIRFTVPNAPGIRRTVPPFSGFANGPGGDNTIEETRIDPYVMLSGDRGALKWEGGLRYETTETTIEDPFAEIASERVSDTDYGILLPSLSLRYALTEADRLTFSAARTVRRPSFDSLSPALLEEEAADNDVVGNPFLEPETAVGFDVGYERRLGRRGVVGINAFYRDVTDLIEVVTDVDASGQPIVGSAGGTARQLTYANVGDGQVYGVEFDLSTPLDFIGMPSTGVFLNYSWLDSEVEDDFGTRTFNSQSDYVFNAGFTHDIVAWEAAFGATYRKQGEALSRVIGEEVSTSYGADLEVFVEKQIRDNIVIRLTGSNLLNASKDEVFDKFGSSKDQIDREYDEYEIETEEAGPVYQLVMRLAF